MQALRRSEATTAEERRTSEAAAAEERRTSEVAAADRRRLDDLAEKERQLAASEEAKNTAIEVSHTFIHRSLLCI